MAERNRSGGGGAVVIVVVLLIALAGGLAYWTHPEWFTKQVDSVTFSLSKSSFTCTYGTNPTDNVTILISNNSGTTFNNAKIWFYGWSSLMQSHIETAVGEFNIPLGNSSFTVNVCGGIFPQNSESITYDTRLLFSSFPLSVSGFYLYTNVTASYTTTPSPTTTPPSTGTPTTPPPAGTCPGGLTNCVYLSCSQNTTYTVSPALGGGTGGNCTWRTPYYIGGNFAAGSYTITWADISGMLATPKTQMQTVSTGPTTWSVSYDAAPTTGAISVASSPINGATFTISNITPPSSVTPSTVTGVPPGTYTVTWQPVAGYSAPAPQTQSVSVGQTTTFTGTYTQCSTSNILTVTPSQSQFNIGEAVAFGVTASNSPTEWEWDFGDGIKEYVQSPSHQWSSTGTFTVSVKAKNTCGWGPANTRQITIIAAKPTAQIVSPNPNKTIYLKNEPVSFIGSGTTTNPNASISACHWNIGGTVKEPDCQFSLPFVVEGYVNITLTVTDSTGTTSEPASFQIQVKDFPIPTVYITAPTNTFAYAGDNVTFQAAVGGVTAAEISKYVWDFGDSSGTQEIQSQTVQHFYATIGGSGTATYTVKVIAYSDRGKVSAPAIMQITVSNPKPTVQITYPMGNSASIPVNGSITFSAQADPKVGSISDWIWVFGDGQTSASPSPTHKFTVVGTYYVTVKVKNSRGVESEIDTMPISVYADDPVASIIKPSPNDVFFVGQEILFEGTGDAGHTTTGYEWNFNDGTDIVTTAKTSHLFTEVKTSYKVGFRVKDINGWSNWTYINVGIKKSNITVKILEPIKGTKFARGESVMFIGNAQADSSIVAYEWNFGDGTAKEPSISSDHNPAHTYDKSGKYTITFRAQDMYGIWSNYASAEVEIKNNDPISVFIMDKTSVAIGGVVTITAKSTDPDGDDMTYKWFINDSELAIKDVQWNYTAEKDGKFVIKLMTTDKYGAFSVYTDQIRVGTGIGEEETPIIGQKNTLKYGLIALVVLASLVVLGYLLLGGDGKKKRRF